MSSRRDADRLRPRRPRIVADSYSDSEPSDDYDNRPRARPSRRARPPPEDRSRRDPPLPVDDRDLGPPPAQTRQRSKVRLKEPSVISSDSETTARRRDRASRRTRTDLEGKDSAEHNMFRSRRDGYLSDEGEALKKSRRGGQRSRRAPNDSDSDPRDGYRRTRGDPGLLAAGGAGAVAGAALPLRGKSMEPRHAAYPEDDYAPRRRQPRGYDTDGSSRRQPAREPREARRSRYDDDYYGEEPPSPRRPRGARPAYDDRDRGYRSDHGGRRRNDGPSYGYGGYDERDPYDRRGGGGGGGRDGYRSDHGPSRYDAYDDPRRGGRGSGGGRYDDPRRGSYDDRRERARSSGGRGGKSSKKGVLGGFKLDEHWQKGATDAFLMYGLPLLKKEGPKWAKQAQNYWVKRGGV